jgi:proteic killer suppression protein
MTFETHAPLLTSALVSISTGQQAWADAGAGDIEDRALRKMRQLDAAAILEDLRSPPGNRLEVLKGSRLGQMSIRINDQWRICFRWVDHDAWDVEIVDYH